MKYLKYYNENSNTPGRWTKEYLDTIVKDITSNVNDILFDISDNNIKVNVEHINGVSGEKLKIEIGCQNVRDEFNNETTIFNIDDILDNLIRVNDYLKGEEFYFNSLLYTMDSERYPHTKSGFIKADNKKLKIGNIRDMKELLYLSSCYKSINDIVDEIRGIDTRYLLLLYQKPMYKLS